MNAITALPEREVTFGREEIIVSKTDLKGRITYANDVFCRVADYTEQELLGQPHNIIRHEDMPRGVFHLLWDAIRGGDEIFAYVKNRSRHGGYYWTLAHVTPSLDRERRVVGYHSSRRQPERAAVEAVTPIYSQMAAVERGLPAARAAEASAQVLRDILVERNCTYEEFIWSLIIRRAA